jgi:hypothetical protein
MTQTLRDVYRYRALTGRCAAGAEIDITEVWELCALENRIEQTELELSGVLRNGRFSDPITVVTVGANGAVLGSCPWVEVGDIVELAIDDDGWSYRFKGRVTWTGEDPAGDLDVALAFVGIPVALRQGPKTTVPVPEKLPHQIAA